MKKSIVIVLILIFSSLKLSAQDISISGSQIRLEDKNAEITSQTIRITKTMTIVSVSGNNAGFWINKNGNPEKAFWTETQAEQAIGYKLQPGVYQVFPNLKADENKADVTILLRK
ncbi:MAG: hypothetical protein MJ211_07960 [Bacteroidales bacterium]|nr:hypothetical protein [Bacteroidales bacterium]